MPSFTPNFALPYPNGSDQPCDFDEQWCDFTEAVDAVFAGFEEGLARTNPIIPMALVKQTQPSTVPNIFQPIPFDTVLVDTAGMADLTANPFAITVNRPGRYMVNGFLETPSSGLALNTELALIIFNGFATMETLERGIIQYRLSAYNSVLHLAGGTQVSLKAASSSPYTVTQAWLSVVWHSDSEVSV